MNTKIIVKCPWCGRMIEVKNGRYINHIQSNKVKCVGSGVKELSKWM